jgi:hypothetical protein
MRGDLTEQERDELLRLSSYMRYEKVAVLPKYL